MSINLNKLTRNLKSICGFDYEILQINVDPRLFFIKNKIFNQVLALMKIL